MHPFLRKSIRNFCASLPKFIDVYKIHLFPSYSYLHKTYWSVNSEVAGFLVKWADCLLLSGLSDRKPHLGFSSSFSVIMPLSSFISPPLHHVLYTKLCLIIFSSFPVSHLPSFLIFLFLNIFLGFPFSSLVCHDWSKPGLINPDCTTYPQIFIRPNNFFMQLEITASLFISVLQSLPDHIRCTSPCRGI